MAPAAGLPGLQTRSPTHQRFRQRSSKEKPRTDTNDPTHTHTNNWLIAAVHPQLYTCRGSQKTVALEGHVTEYYYHLIGFRPFHQSIFFAKHDFGIAKELIIR